MKTIEQIYKPYSFSDTRCYVFILDIGTKGYLKIEHKIPAYVRKLKGIFISVNGIIQPTASGPPSRSGGTSSIVAGFITLNFNGQSLKCFQYSVPQTLYLMDCSHPIPFDEQLNPNSFLQGYYFDNLLYITPKPAYKLSIYLHYEP